MKNFFMFKLGLIFLALMGVGLAGCVAHSGANIYGGLVGQRVVGNESYVTVTNVWNEMDALPLAEKHCAQYGKTARFVPGGPAVKPVFNCVSKSSN